YAHHHECGPSQLIAYPVKPRVFFVLAYETFDLPDARQIIVQQGVHVRRSPTLQTIPTMRSQRVGEGAGEKQREWDERKQRQLCIQIKHHSHNDEHLQNGHDTLLDSVDQHALDRVDVLNHARHQIARGAIVEPPQWQQLDVRIQI